MARILLIVLCVLGGICLPVVIGHDVELGAPPKSEVMLDALATSQKKRARTSFTLAMTRLSSTPPERYSSAGELDCEAATWSLSSPSGEVISVSPDVEDRALWMVRLWLCEPHPVKLINESRGHLDPDDREIFVDGGEFAYRLGEGDGSHLVVDLELERIHSIQFKPSKKSEGHRLVAAPVRDESGEVRLSMSVAGKLVWTARIEPVKSK